MSSLLIRSIMLNSPAVGIDRLVLLYLCETVNIAFKAGNANLSNDEYEAAVAEAIRTGKGLEPYRTNADGFPEPNQTRDTRHYGGGWESLTDLGAKVWKGSLLTNQKAMMSERTRRGQGLPQKSGEGYFPALLWKVDGGARRTKQGTVRNVPAVWRIPSTVHVSVLVPVPTSDRQAKEQKWNTDTAWKVATPLIIKEFRKRRAAERLEKARDNYRLRYKGEMTAEMEGTYTAQIAQQIETEAAQIEAEALAYIAASRAEQERWMATAYEMESWHSTYRGNPNSVRKVAGRKNIKRYTEDEADGDTEDTEDDFAGYSDDDDAPSIDDLLDDSMNPQRVATEKVPAAQGPASPQTAVTAPVAAPPAVESPTASQAATVAAAAPVATVEAAPASTRALAMQIIGDTAAVGGGTVVSATPERVAALVDLLDAVPGDEWVRLLTSEMSSTCKRVENANDAWSAFTDKAWSYARVKSPVGDPWGK